MSLCNPFFGFGTKIAGAFLPPMKMAYRMNQEAHTLDINKITRRVVPEHLAPWVYDGANRV